MIFITGGTGLLGSHIIESLVKAKIEVLALKRKDAKIPDFISHFTTIKWIEGDLFDVTLLEECVDRSEAVIHTAAIVNFSTRNLGLLYKTNVESTKNLVNICLQKASIYFIHISSVAALGRDGTNLLLNEKATWSEGEGNTNYARSKHLAEVELWRGIEEGLKASIVNPSVILGRCDIKKSSGTLFDKINKNSKYYPTGSSNFVDVKDVTHAIIKLLQSKTSGERFILNGFTISNKELYVTISSYLKKSRPKKEITKKMLTFLKPIENIISRLLLRTPEISSDVLKLIGMHYIYDNTKSKEALGLRYSSKEATLEDTSMYFYEKYIK